VTSAQELAQHFANLFGSTALSQSPKTFTLALELGLEVF